MQNNTRYEFRLATSLLQRLRKAAKEEGRTVSNLIRFVLEKYLEARL